jgi:hypothetical protein
MWCRNQEEAAWQIILIIIEDSIFIDWQIAKKCVTRRYCYES